MIARKILKNYWLVISLFIGILVTITLVASIPIYTDGSLQSLVVGESERYQKRTETYPGMFKHELNWRELNPQFDREELLERLEEKNEDVLNRQVIMPKVESGTMLTSIALQWKRDSGEANLSRVFLGSLSGFEENITLEQGRMPENSDNQDVIEVYLQDQTLIDLDILLGEEIRLSQETLNEDIIIRPVGTFKAAEGSELYWPESPKHFKNMFIVEDKVFREKLLHMDNLVNNVLIYSTFDYTGLNINDASKLLPVERMLRIESTRITENNKVKISSPMIGIVNQLLQEGNRFRLMTLSLFIPVLTMLLIYLFMISRLIVERQHAEISVLRSRGAGKRQIAFIYFIETLFLCGIAVLIGPLLGLLMSKMLGSTTGFMEFTQRELLPVKLTLDTYMYAGLAAAVCLISVMVPVLMATKTNIVSLKRQGSRGNGQAIWHRLFIDVVLLLITGYGWYTLHQNRTIVNDAYGNISIDPLLLLIPGLFIIGLTLLCFRIYPWIIALITWLGRKIWPVHMYTTLLQIGRTSKQYQFFMLFLVMAISIGLFSANTAQTVNQNLEEQIRYEAGADIVLQQYWDREVPFELTQAGGFLPEEERRENVRTLYYEPDTSHIKEWPGIKQISRVFTRNQVNVANSADADSNKYEETRLMGIDTKSFGETVSFRSSLLSPDRHWFDYLNLMASQTSSVLISRGLADKLDVHPGEYISMGWDGAQQAHFVVYDIIDYWPSWNPDTHPYFVVGNLSYIQNSMAIEPYQLWISLEDNADRAELSARFEEERLRLTRFQDVQDDLIHLKNDAYLTGLNGSLTLGFLIALVITFIGFLLYWVLSLKSRTLQYGVFRAMGMSTRQLFNMLFWEQILTTGMAVILGVWIGKLTSTLFIPFLQNSLGSQGQLLPFRMVFKQSDEWLVYSFAGILLLVGLGILIGMISRIRIHQAIKIGEE